MKKDPYRAKTDHKHTHKRQQAANERADDQIAPKAVVHSVDALERWALATANIAQNGFRANEMHIVERIQGRYANANAGAPIQDSFDGRSHHAATARSDSSAQVKTTTKRKYPVSPTGASSMDALHADDTAENGARQTKRRRKDEKERDAAAVSSADEDDRYAESSEWSFPSEDEVRITKTSAYIEID